jgi:MFS transporter, FHS family, L-fucose permease
MSQQLTLQRDGANSDTSLEGHVPKADASAAPTATGAAPTATGHDSGYLRVFVFALFFIFGGVTSLNDVIIPKLKELFTLSYAEVMTVQSAFFGAYFIISLPAAAVVRRIGYMRSAAVGPR